MKECQQTKGQSIYEHGISVWEYMDDLLEHLWSEAPPEKEWRIPTWLYQYKWKILEQLLPTHVIEQYCVFHDCGKIFCKTVDENGKMHFPDHAKVSYDTWMDIDGNEQIGRLILMDMDIHKIKDIDIDSFIKNPEAITLLLSGLSEIHSNAEMFGGINSDSFKIKWKQIDKRGKAICRKLFGDISQ
jgi:hypothetical protein